MNSKINLKFLFVPLAWIHFFAIGQDVKKDLMNINKSYLRSEKISMDIKYEVFASLRSRIPLQTEQGKVVKEGTKQFSKIGSIETVNTPDYSLTVDNDEKVISLLKVKYEFNPVSEQFLPVDLDSVLTFCKKINYSVSGKSLESYTFSFDVSEYDSIKIGFNSKTYFIQKISFYYRKEQSLTGDVDKGPKEKPMLIITYSNIDPNPSLTSDFFSYKKYVSKNGAKYVGRDSYKEYEIIERL